MRGSTRRAALAAGLSLFAGRAAAQTPPPALTALVDGGSVALICHASAPGTGDPPEFRFGSCETQRNLDQTGRSQAADLGRSLREAGVLVTQVRSSRWCRALETAALAFPDVPTIPDAALDDMAGDDESRARQARRARGLVSRWSGRQGVLALVTHPATIGALTGIAPDDGEIVALRPRREGFEIAGRWNPHP